MNKNLFTAAILLTFLFSSLVSSIPSFGSQYPTHKDMGIVTSSLTADANMKETVVIDNNGNCRLSIVMANSTALDYIYSTSLGFDESAPYVNQTVPTSLSMDATYDLTNYVDPTLTVNSANPLEVLGDIPVNSSFCAGIYQQQLLSLGINITQWINVKMCRSTVTGNLLVYVDAWAEFLKKEEDDTNWKISIGPPNWNVSCDRANYVLTQIGYIQEMLNSTFLPGYELYVDTWVTTFVLPGAADWSNYMDLIGKNWRVNFGPGDPPEGTYMEASILPISSLQSIVLQQEMFVRNKTITKTAEELLEQKFLCYKVFNIEYSGPGLSFLPASVCVGGIEDFSWGVDLTLLTVSCDGLDVTFSDSDIDINMVVSFNLSLKAHVGLKTKWFRLRKFEAWMQFDGDISVDFILDAHNTFSRSWDQDIFEWGNDTRWYTFWIGPIPVVMRPLLVTTAKLGLTVQTNLHAEWGADATGFVRAGVGWKRDEGFYPIFKAGMDVNVHDPSWSSDMIITITPSLGFKPTLLFYEAVGPYVEIEPYISIIVSGASFDVDVALGIRLNVGIAFSGWFERITGLDDWEPATIWDWVLWERPERPDHDVAVVDVRMPEGFFSCYVYENATFSVDVVNLGKNTENIDVTLYYREHDFEHPGEGVWEEFDYCYEGNPQSLSLDPKSCGTLNFTCLLDPPTEGWYEVNATATISNDGDTSNNAHASWPPWYFVVARQDVVILSLSTSLTIEGKQQIDVTVDIGEWSYEIAALPVFLYYKDGYSARLISEVWCEYTQLEFDLWSPAILTFESDVIRDASEYIAVAPRLPHERNDKDNIYPRDFPSVGRFLADINRDGFINIKDAVLLGIAFGSQPGDDNWNPAADINDDGFVNIKEAVLLGTWYGRGGWPTLP